MARWEHESEESAKNTHLSGMSDQANWETAGRDSHRNEDQFLEERWYISLLSMVNLK